jgi:hypothetical protein
MWITPDLADFNTIHTTSMHKTIYMCAPISAGNMFHDLLQSHETADNTECYIYDICVTNINTLKFINKSRLSEHKHFDNMANANSGNARSRMEANSAGKHEYGSKG